MSEIQKQQVANLIENREVARLGGGEKAIEKQHSKGKYTARERIHMLLDWYMSSHRISRLRPARCLYLWRRRSAR